MFSISEMIENKYVRHTYNSIAQQFDKTRYKIWDSTKTQILSLLDELPKDRPVRVLEFGCGNGRNLDYLMSQTKCCLFAVEPCSELYQIIVAKERYDYVINCGHFDGLEISVDLVLSVAVIHHLATHERRLSAIKELIGLVTDGGYIILQVMALHDDREMKGWVTLSDNDFLIPWVRTGDLRFYHLFRKGELEEMIDEISGVTIVKSFEDRSNYGVVLRRFIDTPSYLP